MATGVFQKNASKIEEEKRSLLDSPEGLSVVDGLCVPAGIVGSTGGRDFWSLWISLLIGLFVRGRTGGW